MREISYKAWDKVDKKICDVLAMSFLHDSITVDVGGGKYLQDDASRFDLMQYTGLKDVKGVGIHEGNIVKFYDLWDELTGGRGKGRQRVCRVEYVGSGFLVVQGDEDDYEQDLFMAKINDGDLEVIGNIYEHSELLERDEE